MVKFIITIIISILLYGCALTNTPKSGEKIIYNVPNSFFSFNIGAWNELESELRNSETKKIILYWSGEGGDNEIAQRFFNTLTDIESKGIEVKFIIIGQAISNHANAICYGSNYEFRNDGMLIFHPSFDVDKSLIAGYKVYSSNYYDHNLFSTCLVKGILTSSEVNEIINDKQRLEIHANGIREFKPDWRQF